MSAVERTALYRLYDASGKLLYLGIASIPEYRWKLHSDRQPWWHLVAEKTVEWYPDRLSAAAAEVELTEAEKPLYNRHGVRHHEAVRYDDTDDILRVTEWLSRKVDATNPGWGIGTGEAARACSVSRVTVRTAMSRFAESDGRLKPVLQGKYVVTASEEEKPPRPVTAPGSAARLAAGIPDWSTRFPR